MTRFIAACFALSVVFGLTACNTIQGAGKDISKAGDTIEDAAKKSK